MRIKLMFFILMGMTIPSALHAGAHIQVSLLGGVSNYSDGILSVDKRLPHIPSGGVGFTIGMRSSVDLGLNFRYSSDSFTYSPDLFAMPDQSVESIDFSDTAVDVSGLYKFYQPESRTITAYIGGGAGVCFISLDSDKLNGVTEDLDKKSFSTLHAIAGLRFKLAVFPAAITIEGRYSSFKISEETIGVHSINAGISFYLYNS
ncbi:MAG: hypothetical protein B6244_09195 [Candidatus Cloacimonetes bacterium 4572_55]|nr:MAG: hypothetical protein B6244_09195 [Candidatus Cloacimonetes bacterium 4572_55]